MAVFTEAAKQTLTYFGGSNNDAGVGEITNSSGKWFIGGNTSSSNDIYVQGLLLPNGQNNFGGDQDAFIGQFDKDQPIIADISVLPPGRPPKHDVCIGIDYTYPITFY